jgi:hypothetical protein
MESQKQEKENAPKFGVTAVQLPGADLDGRCQAAREAGADFVEGALTNDDLDALDEDAVNDFIRASRVIPIASVYVGGLTRWSEIYTHPQSREVTLRRLDTAADLAARLGATLILAVKEVVPAEVALPAYKVGWRRALQRLESSSIPLAVHPVRWPLEEALELLEGIGSPAAGLCPTYPEDCAFLSTEQWPLVEICRVRFPLVKPTERAEMSLPDHLARSCKRFVLDLNSASPAPIPSSFAEKVPVTALQAAIMSFRSDLTRSTHRPQSHRG